MPVSNKFPKLTKYHILLHQNFMVVKAGLKPTYNLLLNTWYNGTSPIFHFKKQFLTLLELSSDLLPTLSASYDKRPDSMLRLSSRYIQVEVKVTSSKPHIWVSYSRRNPHLLWNSASHLITQVLDVHRRTLSYLYPHVQV